MGVLSDGTTTSAPSELRSLHVALAAGTLCRSTETKIADIYHLDEYNRCQVCTKSLFSLPSLSRHLLHPLVGARKQKEGHSQIWGFLLCCMTLLLPNALALHPLIHFSIIRPCSCYIALLISKSLLLRSMSFPLRF